MIKIFFVTSESKNSFGVNEVIKFLGKELNRYCLVYKKLSVLNLINNKITEAAKYLAGGLKWVLLQIEKYVIKSNNDKLKLAYFLLFPNERPLLKIQIELLNDGIACVFRKIIGTLFNLALNFLRDAVGKVLNAGQCILENFVAAIFGDIIGQVAEAVNGILSDISDCKDKCQEDFTNYVCCLL